MIVAALALAISTITVHAEGQRKRQGEGSGGPQQRGQRFAAMDTNKDNKVSSAESTGMLKKNFAAIDTNHDGFIDPNELRTYCGNKRRTGQK
jgi:hypothetical protein